MPTKLRFSTLPRNAEAGSAFMEFFFALPFLLFVILLSMNFCKAYLAQQRAMVAVRYLAWADVERQPPPSSNSISGLFFGGQAVQSSTSDGGINAGVEVPGDEQSAVSGFLGKLGSVSNSISGTRGYRVSYTYIPTFAHGDYFGIGMFNWFPNITIAGTISTDSEDWRYPDLTFWQLLKNTVSGVAGVFGQLIGNLF